MKQAQRVFFIMNFSVYLRICEAALFLSFSFLFPHAPFFYLYTLYIYIYISMYIYKYIIIYNIKNNRYKGAFIGTREGLIKGVGGPFRRGYVVPSKVLGRDYRGTTEGLLSTFVVPSYSHNKKAGVFLGLQLESMLFFTPEKTTYYKTPFLAPYAGFN